MFSIGFAMHNLALVKTNNLTLPSFFVCIPINNNSNQITIIIMRVNLVLLIRQKINQFKIRPSFLYSFSRH